MATAVSSLIRVPRPNAGEVVIAVCEGGNVACVKGPSGKLGLVGLDETVAMLLAAAQKKSYPQAKGA